MAGSAQDGDSTLLVVGESECANADELAALESQIELRADGFSVVNGATADWLVYWTSVDGVCALHVEDDSSVTELSLGAHPDDAAIEDAAVRVAFIVGLDDEFAEVPEELEPEPEADVEAAVVEPEEPEAEVEEEELAVEEEEEVAQAAIDSSTPLEDPPVDDTIAEEERWSPSTLFGNMRVTGGYGGLTFAGSRMLGQQAALAGGRGGVVLGHHVTIGLAGYGEALDLDVPNNMGHEGTTFLGMGYGGLLLEYIVMPRQVVHFSGEVLIGGGGFGFGDVTQTQDGAEPDVQFRDEGRGFGVIEPGLNVGVNVTRWMRILGGASYRFVTDFNDFGVEDEDLEGMSYRLSLLFGRI